ncbi:molybdopterin-containing oxidoreductase family protein [Pseudonocardia yuanmonensis]|uniref:molybdopterin-containing oxidoreductase family protein n=1 Tax=Pseudonocardia yuanmonensis TaxID=1095914 RepID=UPI0031E50522
MSGVGPGERRTATYCRVCEPACGLVAVVREGELVTLEPDRDHPVSGGFACRKGLAGAAIHSDPDRLDHPLHRFDGETEVRSWDDAVGGIATTLTSLLEEYGPESIGLYMGNPASFNSQVGIGTPELFARLGVTRVFNSATQDCSNKFAAATAMFGTSALHPLPDLRRTDALLLLGSNWRVSKGSFLVVPNAYRELTEAAARGARIWFVNPRDTETAGSRTGETVPIRPDTDVYLLAALIHEIDRTVGFDPVAGEQGTHLDGLRAFVADFPPERVAEVCGIPAERIREIARDFAAAPRAAAHMSTGVNMGRQGMLAYWLMTMLVLVTGNLDREGGNIPGREVYPATLKARGDLAREVVDGEFGPMRRGHLPGALLADYVLDAERPLRALVVIAGNPLLTIPGEERLRKALEALELLVVIDLYPNATGEYADWLLPAADMFERADVNVAGLGMQASTFVQWTPAVVPPRHERREEWWILARIAQEMGLPSVLDAEDPETARWSRVDHMLAAGGLTREQVTAFPHGLPVGDAEPGSLFARHIQTADGRVDCRPAAFDAAIARCARIFDELAAEDPAQLKLIARRDAKAQNSWYANVPEMKRGDRDRNPLTLNPADAERLGLAPGDEVVVRSAWGEVQTSVALDPGLRPGVVAMEHGWGLQPGLRLSRERPGVNVNRLMPHGPGSYEPESNMARLTGIPVEVRPLRLPSAPAMV